MEEGAAAGSTTTAVCVTGAGGFVASWLVERLLAGGRYVVHGTVRDPGDAKNAHLAAMGGAADRLRLFRADLLDDGAVAAAIAGCDGVFHVASPVPSTNSIGDPEGELLAPAVTGTMNVLKACSEAKVKRVVLVSSMAAVRVNPRWPQNEVMDEACWSDVEFCRTTQNWYCLSKTLAEMEAFDYAKRTGLDVVSVCPSLVIGPLLQSTVNASSSIIVDCLKGDREKVETRFSNIVDVRDVADALLLAYEKPEASGRYICSSHPIKVSDMVNILKTLYPTYSYPNSFVETDDNTIYSSEKLHKLGWTFRPVEETLRDSVQSYKAFGILN